MKVAVLQAELVSETLFTAKISTSDDGKQQPEAKFTDEQYATINQSTAGRFNLRVFVNCLQVKKCCERRLFIWLQS